jgi:hypothetical protein
MKLKYHGKVNQNSEESYGGGLDEDFPTRGFAPAKKINGINAL